MASPRSVDNTPVVIDQFQTNNSDAGARENGSHTKETMIETPHGYIGVLQVYVHQARDIQNICIYHKQDVYSRLCLTSDPDTSVSTKTINGGGKNPIFNDNLRLNVRTLDASLKCEVWMLSRVKNYLQDQLLGVALIPLSHLFVGNDGKLAQEFPLSSNDLFHSPSGFVQLSISYHGAQPDVFQVPAPRASLAANTTMQDVEILDSLPNEYDKIEFPDPNIVNENHLMVSQYFGLESKSSECLLNSEDDSHLDSEAGVRVVESFSEGSHNSCDVTKNDTPTSSVLTNGSPVSVSATSPSSCDTPSASKSASHELVSPLKDKDADFSKDDSDSSTGVHSYKSGHSVRSVNIVQEKKVVQQEIVDMYLKSMHQFTESLAKMKLPMDIEKGAVDSGNANGSSEKKLQTPKSTGSRVFYGSRAFF